MNSNREIAHIWLVPADTPGAAQLEQGLSIPLPRLELCVVAADNHFSTFTHRTDTTAVVGGLGFRGVNGGEFISW